MKKFKFDMAKIVCEIAQENGFKINPEVHENETLMFNVEAPKGNKVTVIVDSLMLKPDATEQDAKNVIMHDLVNELYHFNAEDEAEWVLLYSDSAMSTLHKVAEMVESGEAEKIFDMEKDEKFFHNLAKRINSKLP